MAQPIQVNFLGPIDVPEFLRHLIRLQGQRPTRQSYQAIRSILGSIEGNHEEPANPNTIPTNGYELYGILDQIREDPTYTVDIPALIPLTLEESTVLLQHMQAGRMAVPPTLSPTSHLMRYVYAALENPTTQLMFALTDNPSTRIFHMQHALAVAAPTFDVNIPRAAFPPNAPQLHHTHWEYIFSSFVNGTLEEDETVQGSLFRSLSALQDLQGLSYYLVTLGMLITTAHPNESAYATLKVAIRRTTEPKDGILSEATIKFVTLPKIHITEYGHDADALAQWIINVSTTACNFNSEEYDDEDSCLLLIIGCTITIINPHGQLQLLGADQIQQIPPLHQPFTVAQAQRLVTTLRTLLRLIYANAPTLPESEHSILQSVGIQLPGLGICLFDCLFLASMQYAGRLYLPNGMDKKKLRQIHQHNMNVLGSYHQYLQDHSSFYQHCNVYEGIKHYLTHVDPALPHVTICIAHKMSTTPRGIYAKVSLNMSKEELVIESQLPSAIDGSDMVILIYANHAIITNRTLISHFFKDRTRFSRILTTIKDSSDYRTKELKQLVQKIDQPIRYPFTKHGYTHSHSNSIWMAFDTETGECMRCKNTNGQPAHHAVVLSVALTLHTTKCFVGFECPQTGVKGCITQFLEYLKAELIDSENGPKSTMVYIPAFNFSKFDGPLLLQSILHNHVTNVQIIPKGVSTLMAIKWHNITFFDMRKIYAGSLDSVFKSFHSDSSVQEDHPPGTLPQIMKYACFPYALLNQCNWDSPLTREVLKENWVWKGKKSQPCSDEEIGAVNYAWWMNEFPDTPMNLNLREITMRYCDSDTWLLLFICLRHLKTAIGIKNSIAYNAEGAITVASMAWKVFTRCYVKDEGEDHVFGINPLMSADLQLKVHDAITEFTMGDILRFSKFGGYVFNHIRLAGATHDYHENEGHRIIAYDINSSYPFQGTRKLPTKYLGSYRPPQSFTDFDETSLYGVSIEFPQDMTHPPAAVRCCNVTLRPSVVMFYYPTSVGKGGGMKMALFVEWGIALKRWSKIPGIVIKTHMCWKFAGGYPMRQFYTDIYNDRLVSKGICPTTYQHTPHTVNKLMDVFDKSLMNNTFGKTLQGPHSQTHIIHSLEQLMCIPPEQIVGMDNITVGSESYTLLETYDGSQPTLDNFAALGSYILSCGRVDIWNMIDEVVQLGPELARPICGDTDSCFIQFKKNDPKIDALLEKYTHEYRLGAFKSEGQGQLLISLGPKMYILYPDIPTSEGKPTTSAKCKTGSKGVPKSAMLPEFYYQLAHQQCPFISIPMNSIFKPSLSGVHTLPTGMTRRISMKNVARLWSSDPRVESKPFPSIEAFLDHYQHTSCPELTFSIL